MNQPRISGLHHLQIAIPAGQEKAARHFYSELLGMDEVPVPQSVAGRAALWFECGAFGVHIGVDPDFHPSRKGHPAFLVENLSTLVERLRATGLEVTTPPDIPGMVRCHIFDPFGNRIELVSA